MFKNILFSLSLLLAAATSLHAEPGHPTQAEDKEAYANYYSTTTQDLDFGQAVSFESHNAVKKFAKSTDGTTITVKQNGVYSITYTAVGFSLSDSSSSHTWGLALTRNGEIIKGSSVEIQDFDFDDSSEIVGQVIVHLKKHDTISLVNNSTEYDSPIRLFSVAPGDDVSASIVIENLED